MQLVPFSSLRNFDLDFYISNHPHLEPHGEVWDTYASSTLKGRERMFVAIQIRPPSSLTPAQQVANISADEPSGEVFSIFAVMHNGRSECIGEISHRGWAKRYAEAVAHYYGWQLLDVAEMQQLS